MGSEMLCKTQVPGEGRRMVSIPWAEAAESCTESPRPILGPALCQSQGFCRSGQCHFSEESLYQAVQPTLPTDIYLLIFTTTPKRNIILIKLTPSLEVAC